MPPASGSAPSNSAPCSSPVSMRTPVANVSRVVFKFSRACCTAGATVLINALACSWPISSRIESPNWIS